MGRIKGANPLSQVECGFPPGDTPCALGFCFVPPHTPRVAPLRVRGTRSAQGCPRQSPARAPFTAGWELSPRVTKPKVELSRQLHLLLFAQPRLTHPGSAARGC